MKCPNKNLEEWKLLVNELGEEGAYRVYLAAGEEVPPLPQVQQILTVLTKNKIANEKASTDSFDIELNTKLEDKLKKLYPEIKLEYTNKPIPAKSGEVFNQKDVDDSVNYMLKAVNILNSDKASQVFSKGEKAKWDIDKILTELAVPKEQKEIIKDSYYLAKEIGLEVKPEELALDIASKYSYSVEVKTAIIKNKIERTNLHGSEVALDRFTYQGITYINSNELNTGYGYFENNYIIDITEEEYSNKLMLYRNNDKYTPTQHYSNLTVPGGTNYTENRIITPQIIPSIKGHAQFAENEDIGWFRSDDKVEEGTFSKEVRLGNIAIEDVPTNFMLGNDTTFFKKDNEWYQQTYNEEPVRLREVGLGESEVIIAYQSKLNGLSVIDNSLTGENYSVQTNTFGESTKTRRILELQSDLFQKGRDKKTLVNGVTLTNAEEEQDLIDKGYEVLDSKAEYPVYVKNEVNSSNQFLQLLNKDNNWVTFFIKSIIQDSAKKGYEKVLFPKGETAAKIEGHETLANEIETINEQLEIYNQPDSGISKDVTENLEKRKQELKSQGIEKLKPIEAFYEIKVGNILNKQFGKDNVKVITDEFGNQWNEITVNNARDLSPIMLQKDKDRILGQANIKAMSILIDAINMKQDTLPHEYAHHYIAWFRNTPIVQEAIKKWGSEEALVQSIGEQAVRQKGEAYGWWNKFVEWLMNKLNSLTSKDKEELTKLLTDAFLTRKNLEDLQISETDRRTQIEYFNSEQAKPLFEQQGYESAEEKIAYLKEFVEDYNEIDIEGESLIQICK